MHDFSEERFQTILAYIDSITFSCDSVYAEKDRKGFNPDLFQNNIKYLKTHHPKTGISISTTLSNATVNDVKATTQFAKRINATLEQYLYFLWIFLKLKIWSPLRLSNKYYVRKMRIQFLKNSKQNKCDAEPPKVHVA